MTRRSMRGGEIWRSGDPSPPSRPCQGAEGRSPEGVPASLRERRGHPIVGSSSPWRRERNDRRRFIREMTQTTGRFFDELGKLITDAAGAADGVRKEIEGVVRAQAERVLRDLDVVQREEFEAVKAMAQKAREENERLKERIAVLEAAIVKGLAGKGG